MREPLVSIIMPAYNAERYIEEAIKSVQKQDYQNWELLICDDCSEDNTIEIIERNQIKDNRIKLFKLDRNSGAAIARNTCIEKANGDFIAFLDSDDLWKQTKLRKQINFMMENEYNFTCTYYDKVDGNGMSLNILIKYKNGASFSDLLKNCPGNSTVIYNSKKLGKFYIPNIKKRNDYLMWFCVIEKSKKLYCFPGNLSSHRETNLGISSSKRTLLKYHWVIYRMHLKLSTFKSVKICFYWVVKGTLNKFKRIKRRI